jgi:hypothetical protein
MKINKGLILFITLITTNLIAIYYLINILLFIISIALFLHMHSFPIRDDIKFRLFTPIVTNFYINNNLLNFINKIYNFFKFTYLNDSSLSFQQNYKSNTIIFFEEEQFKSLLLKIFLIFLTLFTDLYIFIFLF